MSGCGTCAASGHDPAYLRPGRVKGALRRATPALDPASAKSIHQLSKCIFPGVSALAFHPNFDHSAARSKRHFLLSASGAITPIIPGAFMAIRDSGSIFACQHCHKLAYQCQRETDDDRAMRRADKIRRRLGWGAGIANPEGGKPKGMHRRTFERLKAEHDAFANASWAGMAERLGLMNRRLVGLGLDPLDDLGRDG